MATKVRRPRTKVSSMSQAIMVYLSNRDNAAQYQKAAERTKKDLKPFVAENGEAETNPDTGRIERIRHWFAQPLFKKYYGLELRSQQGPEYLDEAEVLKFIRENHPELERRIFPRQPVFQQDKLYAAQAEGKITDAELRALIHEGPELTPQLWPIEAPKDEVD